LHEAFFLRLIGLADKTSPCLDRATKLTQAQKLFRASAPSVKIEWITTEQSELTVKTV